eukprot:SAG22_NODE_3092_length_1947_cov_1.851190_1_plen_480_part_10
MSPPPHEPPILTPVTVSVLRNCSHQPNMAFFRAYLTELGANIPEKPAFTKVPNETKADKQKAEEAEAKAKAEEEAKAKAEADAESSSEEEGELVDEKLVEADEDPGERSTTGPEWTEENGDKAMAAKQAASEAMQSKDFAAAAEQWGIAIALSPSPITFAKRADCFIKMGKPVAAVRDCDAALVLNPDSAKASKVRGMAKRLLGEYEEALANLSKGQSIDYDDTAQEWLKEVTPFAAALKERKRKVERKEERRVAKQKDKRRAEIKKANDEARKKQAEQEKAAGGGPGGGGGGEGMSIPPELLQAVFADPEVAMMMQDPAIQQGVMDCLQDPNAMARHQGNPAVMMAMQKIQEKLMGMMGGMGGMGVLEHHAERNQSWWMRDGLFTTDWKFIWMWSPTEVARWVGLLEGLEEYAEVFVDNGIDGNKLLIMDGMQLTFMGIDAMGHKARFMDEIAYLRKWGPSKHVHRYVTGDDVQSPDPF